MPDTKRWFHDDFGERALMSVASIIVISVAHHLIPLHHLVWHNLLQHAYYLPIVLAGLSYGWLGGLGAAVFAGLSHLPHIILTWGVIPNYSEDQLVETLTFCLAGVLTGVAAQRDRSQRRILEGTMRELSRVYKELQENFEQMKRAERLYAVGQLSAGLAHEIRNPLASIAGAAGILQRRASGDTRLQECAVIIARECDRLNALLKEFLDFARPRQPRLQSVDIDGVLASVIDLAKHASGRHGITIQKRVPAGIPGIHTDPAHLEQALLNLIINAVQASGDGEEVTVSAQAEGSRVVIRVVDHGVGIDPAKMDQIFDPFFTTKENGTGLGLSVAHQIARQLGGTLTASLNSDRGMTFCLQLPLRQEAAK